MATTTLEQLYEVVFHITKKFRKKFPEGDETGLREIIEDKLPDISATKWKRDVLAGGILYLNFSEKVLNLPEKTISGNGDIKLINRNHYMIQIFRIPLKYEPTLLNIILIAFFSGQLYARLVQSEFPEGLVKTFKNLRVQSLLNFIEEEEWKELSKSIPQESIDALKKELNMFFRDYE